MTTTTCTGGHACATCADRADRAVIEAIPNTGESECDALVRLPDGATARVAIDLVPGVGVGDAILIHQGVAIAQAAEGTR